MDGVGYKYMIDMLHTELLRCCGLASRVGPPRASEVASRAAQGRDPVAFVSVEVLDSFLPIGRWYLVAFRTLFTSEILSVNVKTVSCPLAVGIQLCLEHSSHLKPGAALQ